MASSSSPQRSPKRLRTKEPPPPAVATPSGRSGRSVEEIYQKKTQLEHILLRPDSYVGSVERQDQEHWVIDPDAEGSKKMVKKKLNYVPALFKIFDEILVNAADNLVRCPEQDEIRVAIDQDNGLISVSNNGKGLPVQKHQEHKCYVPELVFGHLLTSDNYDDAERKVTGGRNGYGAKLTNIFSSTFMVETADSSLGKKYTQVWERNMGKCGKPLIEPFVGADFTRVTFYPDLERFGMDTLEDDIVALMRRRAYDVAAATHGRCMVWLNDQELDVRSFEDYVDLYVGPETFRTCSVVNERWEVAVSLTDGSGFQQVSLVNSISTSRGGTHVNLVVDQLASAVLERVSKQKGSGGGLSVKATHVRSHLWVFVNCLIENPAFDSQTKETLTTKKERFGSSCSLPDSMIDAVLQSGLVEALQEWSKAFAKSELAQHLNRADGAMQRRLFGIPKLEDANKAGTKQSESCTLVLTEGDSAKALVVAGMSIVGRDHYGVFPLRGKLRNVRDLTAKQMLENKEIEQIMKIMALDASKEYVDAKGLRYGSIMIMTDQDLDGSHIKGLLINFIQHFFPSLFRMPGFLKEFVTPIVKATKDNVTKTFFTLQEYQQWMEEHGDKGWTCKYYKGLGTSTAKEAKEYFSALKKHEIKFKYQGAEDDDRIDMAFNKDRAEDRKKWISALKEDEIVDHSTPTLSYSDFVNKELVHYAKYDVDRNIPNMMDGLKLSQRKVLYGCFKRKLTKDTKVAQLSGYVAEHTLYHHGEVSLQSTIIGLAQNFVGSNNINLLVPSGQFGTRLQGGKDHAAARYIFTRLSKVTRCIFPEADDAVLEHLKEDGQTIEPKWFCPVIPMVLVNGAEGIGVGWSTSIPNYNPREIVANIRRWLRNENLEPMHPWYKGFKGSVTAVLGSPQKYEVFGVAVKRSIARLEITELPLKKWTQDYKEWLIEQLPAREGGERRSMVTDIREHHTENSVHFVLAVTPDKLAEAERKGLEKTYHLRSTMATTNMWLFDHAGSLKKFESPEAVIEDFAKVRLDMYQKRKEYLIGKLVRQQATLSHKYKFILMVVTGRLIVEQKKSAQLCKELRKEGFATMADLQGREPPEPGSAEEAGPNGFKYLLSMKMWTMTEEKLEELKRQQKQKELEIDQLLATECEELWERDLKAFEEALDAFEQEEARQNAAALKQMKKLKEEDDGGLVNQRCVLLLSRDFRAKRILDQKWKSVKGKANMKTVGKAGGGLKRKRTEAEAAQDVKKEDEVQEIKEEDEEPDCKEEGDQEQEEQLGAAEGEGLQGMFCCHSFDALIVFSETAQAHMLQALDVPVPKRGLRDPGVPITDFLPAFGSEHVSAVISVPQAELRKQCNEIVILVSALGFVKKVTLDRFRGLRPGRPVLAMRLGDGDRLRWALRADAKSALILASAQGKVLRVPLSRLPSSSLKAPGRICLRSKKESGDTLAGACISGISAAEMGKTKVEAPAAGNGEAGPPSGTNANDKVMGGSRQALCVDDDSDNPMEEEYFSAEEDAEVQAGDEVDNDSGDEAPMVVDVDGADEDEAEDTLRLPDESGVAVEGGKAEVDITKQRSPSPARGHSDLGQALLLVTEQGFGQKMSLAIPRLALRPRGAGAGKPCFKLAEGDQVMGACVVSEDAEVMLGSSHGATNRINMRRLPVAKNPTRGRVLAKLLGDDILCSISVLPTVDDEEEEAAARDGGGAKAQDVELKAEQVDEEEEDEEKLEPELDPAEEAGDLRKKAKHDELEQWQPSPQRE